MIESEREACQKRLSDLEDKRILVVQDTTSFNFAAHHKQGLGVLDDNRSAGFFAHTSLAVSLQGVPLGLLEQSVWQRPLSTAKKDNAHQALPICEKESRKWLDGLESSISSSTPIEYITVCDREADIYELFQFAHNAGAKFIVRAAKNRRLEAGGLLFEALASWSPHTAIELEIASRRGAETHVAQLELRFSSLTVLPPKNRSQQNSSLRLEPLLVQAIDVREVACAADLEPIHWIVLTNLTIDNAAVACQILKYYSYRWLVERFHYVLKSGCEFETSQLQTYEALRRFLGLCSSIAWRLLWMTYQARQTPEASCASILSTSEWQALCAYMGKSPDLPKQAPSLRQAMRWIAQLGGFIGRKRDGDPGVKVLWRGWEVLQTIHAAWLIFHPPQNPHPTQDVGNV